MILKEKDSITPQLQQLEGIQKLTYLSDVQRAEVEKKLKILKAGNTGEQDSAYFINFDYQDSQNWVVIHDLRIEYGGFSAQIDHLLINRFLHFFILETKYFSQGIKITHQGEFLRWYNNQYLAMESPIEQNNRHIRVLQKLIQQENLLPKRLGIQLQPKFIPYVLVSPKSRVIRPKTEEFKTDMIIKSDEFFQKVRAYMDSFNSVEVFTSLAKLVSTETIVSIGNALICHHQPAKFNYFRELGIAPDAPPKVEAVNKKIITKKLDESSDVAQKVEAVNKKIITKKLDESPEAAQKVEAVNKKIIMKKLDESPEAAQKIEAVNKKAIKKEVSDSSEVAKQVNIVSKKNITKGVSDSQYYCYSCKTAISQKIALFCFQNKKRFQGKAYCFNCQKEFSS